MKLKKENRNAGILLVSFFLMAALVFTTSTGVLAYETGDTINYKHTLKGSYDHFTGPGGYEGTCAEIGKSSPDSGTAKVKKLGKSNKMTKIAYHYGFKKGWSNNLDGYKGWVSTYGEVYSHLIRCAHMGFKDWEDGYRAVAGGNDPSAMIAEVKNLYSGVDDLTDAPDDFECLYCDQGNHQGFILFKANVSPPSGFAKVVKKSGNTDITG